MAEDPPPSPPPPPPEPVLGLDPRALLAQVARQRATGAALRAWAPPAVAELGALFPQFEVLGLIGRGGMGAVYRARQPALDRLVAIKLLPVEAAADEAFATRFQTEARALARLQHPRIVAIYEFGQTRAGHLFFVMEYVEGSDLAALLRAGGVPPARALEILRGVCDALQFAHARGIVHRDIKPGNVLIGGDGAVKVADFGVARLRAEADADTPRLTLAGSAPGTPEYMAPEQRAGGEADARGDLYSAGVMLYEMLTGRLPSGAWEPPSRVAKTDPRLDAVVTRAIHPDPAKRFQTAAELLARLEQIQSRPRPRPGRRQLAAALLAVAALAGVAAWLRHEPPRRPPAISRAALPTEAGVIAPLHDLDLGAHTVSSDWRWLDGREADTLAVAFTEDRALKAVRLPVQPGARGYEVSFHCWLDHAGSDAGILLPVDRGRVALVLDYYSASGLDQVAGKGWKTNPTTVRRELPMGRFLKIEIAARPASERASITVRVEGEPFLEWEGLQSDLSMARGLVEDVSLKDGPHFALVSFGGGLRIREVKVRLLP